MYDLFTKETTIIDSRYGGARLPVIYGDKVVWYEGLGSYDVYVYDLSTQKKTQIATERTL